MPNGYNFTERVRDVLALARAEALRLKHEYIGTEHILLGLLKEGQGTGATALRNLGVDFTAVTASVERTIKRGRGSGDADLPFTSRAKKVLELAMSTARELSHHYVGTEHVLLGLLAEEHGIAAQLLNEAGVTFDAARAEVRAVLGQPSRAPEPLPRRPERPAHDASARHFLRHTVATLAYRGSKALRGAPAEFAAFRAAPGSRSAAEILAHIGDLLDWAHSQAAGQETWRPVAAATWEADVARFHTGLERLDADLSGEAPLHASPERLFQGAIADALTHVGQLAMLRRLAGAAVRGESYAKADIQRGRLGPTQTPPEREFD